MKLQDLLKDIELGKVYTDKDRKPFKVNEETLNEFNKSHFLNLVKQEIDSLKGQIAYSQDALRQKDIEDWEKKEFKGVLKDLLKKLKVSQVHYKRVQKLKESFGGVTSPPPHSSKEAKKVVDDALRTYSKELRKLQGKVVKDWMSKAKSGVIDFFDLVRGFQHGDSKRAYPYEIDFLMSVLTKDKIIDRFRKYFGGKKALNNRTVTTKRK